MLAEVDPALADRVRPHGDSGSGPFPSAWETLVTRCDNILSPVTLATMSGNDVDPAALLRDRGTIYLQIPEARLGDLRPFLRLMWTSLLQQLTSASDHMGADHPPLLLILDEAGRTPFADLPDLLATMRSRRISCAVLIQALSQLRAAYGKHASTILGNCAVHLYARSEDLATQEYLSERLGTAEELFGAESHTSGPHGASVTQSQHRRFRPLLTPQQVRRMPDHAAVAFLPACPPTALARMDWRDHLQLVRRSQIVPPELHELKAPLPSPALRPATEYVDPD
jgi:type IV secretion system protein VirD4